MEIIVTKNFIYNEDQINIILSKHPDSHYIGDFSTKDRNGNWISDTVACFYQPNPDTSKGHSNYFGMFNKYGWVDENLVVTGIYICNAESAFSEPFTGVVYNDKIYISGFTHDFHGTEEGQLIVDGGRDYMRLSVSEEFVKVEMINGKFKIISNE